MQTASWFEFQSLCPLPTNCNSPLREAEQNLLRNMFMIAKMFLTLLLWFLWEFRLVFYPNDLIYSVRFFFLLFFFFFFFFFKFLYILKFLFFVQVEVKPYVLDDQMCDECQGARCGGKFAPFFCANVTCLQYYCEHCWATIHTRPGREFHKPLVKEGADRPRAVPFRWC